MFSTKITSGIGVIVLLVLTVGLARAQTGANTTTDPVVEALNKEKARLAAEKELLDAQRALLEARDSLLKSGLGLNATPTATAPTGKIEGDKDKFIEVQLLAKTAAQEATGKLAKQVCQADLNPQVTTLIIGKNLELTDVFNYRAIVRQTQTFRETYQKQIDSIKEANTNAQKAAEAVEDFFARKPLSTGAIQPQFGPFTAVTMATTGVRLVADLINLFRTTTEFKGQTITGVDEIMIATFLLSESACKNVGVYYPALYPPTGATTKSKLLAEIEELQKNKAAGEQELGRAQQTLTRLEALLKKVQDKIKALTPQATDPQVHDQLDLLAKIKDGLTNSQAQLKQHQENLNSFQASATEFLRSLPVVDAQSKLSLISSLLRAEALATLLDQKDTYVLDLSVTASGITRIRQNIFWNAKPDHTGGVTVMARLFNVDGRMVRGYSADHYYDYVKPEEIRKSFDFAPLNDSASRLANRKSNRPGNGEKVTTERQ